VILGSTKGLASASVMMGSVKLPYGNFLSVLIDFLIIALVVYFGVKGLGLDKIDKKKS
jgi:large-conductance mechanosensitive channel